MKYKTIYDISVPLGAGSIDYPGDVPYSRKSISTIRNGGACELSGLELSAHSGTHIDAPAHFIQDGRTVDQYDVKDFILPALVVPVDDDVSVKPEALADVTLRPGEALLFRTRNSTRGLCRSGVFSERHVHLSPETAEWCVTMGVALVGIDYISVDPWDSLDFKAHRTLLSAGILILESINLIAVPPGSYTLFCLPLRLNGAEAAPVRAVLLR
ncbi:MAG: cyclase family protein [Thermodesulfobacteriota bacterium]